MKKLFCCVLALALCLSVVGCTNTKEIETFVNENIMSFQDVENYITIGDLEAKYENYTPYGEFYIGDINNIKCYVNISQVGLSDYIREICYVFKDSNGKASESIANDVCGFCKQKYSGILNKSYDITNEGILYTTGVSVKLNQEASAQCYADLEGISVEEYNKQMQDYADTVMNNAMNQAKSEKEIENNKSWLVTVAKKEIKNKLVSPNSAKFPFNDSFKVENMGDNEYIVTVDLTSKNAYGVEMESTFSVWIKGTGLTDYTIVDIVGK